MCFLVLFAFAVFLVVKQSGKIECLGSKQALVDLVRQAHYSISYPLLTEAYIDVNRSYPTSHFSL